MSEPNSVRLNYTPKTWFCLTGHQTEKQTTSELTGSGVKPCCELGNSLPPAARAHDLLSTTMNKTKAVTIRIVDVHFAIAPALVSRFQINDDTFGLQFFM